MEKITSEVRVFVWLGGIGFILGLLPRIASILIGETSRGGQGFDVDFNPIKLFAHLWDIVVRTFPKLFSLGNPYQGEISSISNFESFLNFFGVPLLMLLISSAGSFCSAYWGAIKNILTLKTVKFDPGNIYILLPILTCLANILVQNGSEPRYLFPMFGTIVLWVGVFANNFKDKIKGLPIFILSIWLGFYSLANYSFYKEEGVINGFQLVKLERIKTHDLVEFLQSKNIEVAYSDYAVSSVGTYLSKGEINISEYNDNPAAKTQKTRSLVKARFAIIAQNDEATTYSNYLLQNKIEFKVDEVRGYKIYWDFSGDQSAINQLRSLIHEG